MSSRPGLVGNVITSRHGRPIAAESGKRLLETVVQVGRPSPAKFPILAIIEKTVRPLFT